MINIKTIEVLKKHGYAMADIKAALDQAEKLGEYFLDGWCIRYNSNNDMIILHPARCGIYIGDFAATIHFERSLTFSYGNIGFHKAKYSELEKILSVLSARKTNGYILCECYACDFQRRKKQVEKLGYEIHKSNIEKCDTDTSVCNFLIA